MVIDFHTHIFPEKIVNKAIATLEESGGIKAKASGDEAGLLKSMENAGIDLSISLPIATKPSQVSSINRFAASINEKRGSIISFGSLHPFSEHIEQELEELKALGLKGIKLHPDFQNFFIDSPESLHLLKLAAENNLTIMLHAGLDVSFRDCHHCTPRRLHNILPELKNSTIIMAHLGGVLYYDEVEKYLIRSNVYLDTSFTYSFTDDTHVTRILNSYNPDLLLFGTDSPWDDQKKALELMQNAPISSELKEKILYKNAKRLLGL